MIPALGLGLMGMSHSTAQLPVMRIASQFSTGRYNWVPRIGTAPSIYPSTLNSLLNNSLILHCSMYGDSEILLGKWFEKTGKRDEIFLTTKFGIVERRAGLLANWQFGRIRQESLCREPQAFGYWLYWSLLHASHRCKDIYRGHDAYPDRVESVRPVVNIIKALLTKGEEKTRSSTLVSPKSVRTHSACLQNRPCRCGANRIFCLRARHRRTNRNEPSCQLPWARCHHHCLLSTQA